LRIDKPEISNPIIINELVKEGMDILSFQEIPQTIEQVYLAAMSKVNRD
jgi:hypothetical protein